jgi:hypothetical protein
LKNVAPKGKLFCSEFEEIIKAGASGKHFEPEHNISWTMHTRPFVEAFFHAKFFLRWSSNMEGSWKSRRKRFLRVGPQYYACMNCVDSPAWMASKGS